MFARSEPDDMQVRCPMPDPPPGGQSVVRARMLDTHGRVFAQRRSATRRLFPNGWDLVGGTSMKARLSPQPGPVRSTRGPAGSCGPWTVWPQTSPGMGMTASPAASATSQ